MKQTTDLGRDKVWVLVLKLAVPSMIAQFVTVLYSIIDRMYIGHIAGHGTLWQAWGYADLLSPSSPPLEPS